MNKKAAVIGLGVLGVGALGYYAYMRSRGQVSPQFIAQSTVDSKPLTLLPTQSSFPDKATLLRAVQANRWHSDYFNAINTTYNQQTGQARHGDWLMQVIGVNPIAIKFNKGAETFTLTSTVNGLGSLSPAI